MTKRRSNSPHPAIPELADQLTKGAITRRDFVRTSTLLGLSAGAAYAMAGKLTGTGMVPKALAQATPKRGGNLRVGMAVKAITDPATYDWSEKGNVARQVIEPLVQIGPDNIARPHLLESWAAVGRPKDLDGATPQRRNLVKMAMNSTLTMSSSMLSAGSILRPGPPNQGRFASMTKQIDGKDKKGKPAKIRVPSEGAVEKIDDHTVRFNLNTPDLSLPESMGDYPALIVHRRFSDEGGDLGKNPVGTGAFALKSFGVGDKAVLRAPPR